MSVRILEGDALQVLRTLPDCSVQCCVTSPPYWGLRDYGVVGQLGLERTPDAYVAAMVAVFGAVRRVLRDDGTLWLNIGDSYGGGRPSPGRNDTEKMYNTADAPVKRLNDFGIQPQCEVCGRFKKHEADGWFCDHAPKQYKAKDLIGIPWMLAFALRADGWYLRSDIIWHKPNPMPESVTDRPTKAHEYLFLFAKSPTYYYDADAIREDAAAGWRGSSFTDERDLIVRPTTGRKQRKPAGWDTSAGGHGSFHRDGRAQEVEHTQITREGRNRRSVWTVSTQPFAEAHFATFPPKLIEPCILAGSAKGQTVLDPFGGAGTTGLVADRLGRDALLIELNPKYAEMARRRIHSDNPLFGDVA